MSPRPKHTRPGLESLLKEAEAKGWRVEKRNHYKMKCPCPRKCLRNVACTPSTANYERNLRGWLRRNTCWEA